MNTSVLHRFYRWGLVLCLVFPLTLMAQPLPGTHFIRIELISENYDCSTGQLSISFKVINEREDGIPGRYASSFHIQSGTYYTYGSTSRNDMIHEFSFPYTIGNQVIIGAMGIIDNEAPYIEYRFTPSSASLPAPPVISSSGTMPLCNGASVTLTATGSTGNYIWSNGATGNSITVSTAGNYSARAINSCGESLPSNVIEVTVDQTPGPPVVSPSGNLLLCNGESATLAASGNNIQWSTGATGNSITVSSAGSYYCTSSNGCGNSTSSNVVTVNTVSCPTPLPGSNFSVCPGRNKTLDAGDGYDSYLWSTGASTRTISAGPGTYTVTVSKDGCYATSAPVTVSYFTVTTPTITVSGPLQFCQGGSVTLSSSEAISYLWNTGATTQSINVGSSGSFFVSTIDANGCSATSAAVNVTVNSLPTANISGGGNLCQNSTAGTVVFTGSGGVAPYTFSFRVNGGSVQTISTTTGNTASISVSSGAVGTYTYALVGVRESSPTACENSASGEVTVQVNERPTATISGSATVCVGASSPVVTLTGSGGTAPYVFTYELNGGAVQTITSFGTTAIITVPTNADGTFSYRLISVRDASATACTSIQSGIATVVVNAMPVTPVIATTNAHLCNGASTVISVQNGEAGTTYHWYRNGVLLSSGTANSFTVTTAGNYTVTAVSPAGCSTPLSNSILISTGTVPTPVIIGTGKVCPGGSTPLRLGSKEGLGFDRWFWMLDSPFGGVLSEDSLFSFQAGQYRLSVEAQGCRDSIGFTVTADDTEYPAGKIALSANEISYGSMVRLRAAVSPAVLFNWDLGNGRRISTRSDTISANYYQSGDRIPIHLDAITERGCKTSFQTYVKVAAMKHTVLADRSFAGSLKDWNVFPNPFDQQLKVSVILQRSETVVIDLFDMHGRLIKSWRKNGRAGENLFNLEGSETLPGRQTYFITGFYNGIKHTDKIYKQ